MSSTFTVLIIAVLSFALAFILTCFDDFNGDGPIKPA